MTSAQLTDALDLVKFFGMRMVTVIVLLGITFLLWGCATGPGGDDPERQAAEEAAAAQRVEDFVRNPPQ